MGYPLRAGDRRWRLPGSIIALLITGALVTWARPEFGESIGFLGLIIGLPAAVITFMHRSSGLAARERRGWRYAALAMLLFWVGVSAVGALTGLGVQLPAFGPLDIFFVAGYVALLFALYNLARLDADGREWILTFIDATVGGIALAALVWSAFFHDLMTVMSGAPWWEITIAAIYPVLDIVVVVGLLVLVMRRSNYHLDLRLAAFAAASAFQVLADFVYLNRSVGQTFTVGEPAWALNLTATALMLATAAVVDRVPRKREFPEAPTPIWFLIWPYFLAALLLVVHFRNYRSLEQGPDEVLLLNAVIVIVVVIFLRQVYVIYRDRNRVDRKRAELVASVSHELRTPLTAMVGYLTLLDENYEDFPTDSRQEMIAEAANQARHMARLVSDLLMLAKGDTRGLKLEKREVNAMGIVLSVLRNTDPADSRIEDDLDANVMVLVDPDRIQQALANLVNNALRYGGDRCLVVARASGSDLVFQVHDNGPGVPTRYETAIWQHFERGAHRLDATTPGLGIGLSIVQAVMESHGGQAEYRVSERLGGACFSLHIPDAVIREEAVRRPVPASH